MIDVSEYDTKGGIKLSKAEYAAYFMDKYEHFNISYINDAQKLHHHSNVLVKSMDLSLKHTFH